MPSTYTNLKIDLNTIPLTISELQQFTNPSIDTDTLTLFIPITIYENKEM